MHICIYMYIEHGYQSHTSFCCCCSSSCCCCFCCCCDLSANCRSHSTLRYDIYVKRDLHICQKRPTKETYICTELTYVKHAIYLKKGLCMPYMSKKAYICLKRDLQNRPSYAQTDLQKIHTSTMPYMSKEAYIYAYKTRICDLIAEEARCRSNSALRYQKSEHVKRDLYA